MEFTDKDIENLLNLAIELKTRYDQIEFVQNKYNSNDYETEYATFFTYFFIDGYHELILKLAYIFSNDTNNMFPLFKYSNAFIKSIDESKIHEGFGGEEKMQEVKSKLIKQKKELMKYKDIIVNVRNKIIAHVDSNANVETIEMNTLKEIVEKFLDFTCNIYYYKYRATHFFTFTYLSELKEIMEKLKK